MKSPFDFVDSANNSVKTNNFDWSHVFNLTTDIGRITPVFCQLMPAHSSLSGSPRLGLSFMPMVFPLQSRMTARLSFFKIPLRTLWKDYKDFVGNFREGLEEPYNDFKDQIPTTGSLYDYLGLPTTLSGFYGSEIGQLKSSLETELSEWAYYESSLKARDIVPDGNVTAQSLAEYLSTYSQQLFPTNVLATVSSASDKCMLYRIDKFAAKGTANRLLVLLEDSRLTSGASKYLVLSAFAPDSAQRVNIFAVPCSGYRPYTTDTTTQYFAEFNLPKSVDLSTIGTLCLWVVPRSSVVPADINYFYSTLENKKNVGIYSRSTSSSGGFSVYIGSEIRELTKDTSPYYDSSSANANKQLKISAYAARAYEAVYNAFYRDIRNNPYYINGEVQYNQYIPTLDGGPDKNIYKLRYANWEKDSFTTAVQSPQQGIAPLVGITTYQDTVTTENGETNVVNRVALVDEDGRKFGVQFTSDEEGLKDVQYTRLAGDRPVAQSRSLIELAQSGISINDLRNVNAYQKFLELNMRQGYSYKNIIEGRFDVKVRYDELQMPEFIGGFSEPVQFGSQSQTVQRADTGNYTDQLGALAGTGGVRRDGKPISVFCDEESIVLGLLVVVPTPIYTQILPKHFLYRGLLDHFQPEFANIGFQPITYREMCPLQVFNSNPDDLYDTFGYNRPWYELCQQLDTAHGLFRTQLRNFIMNRTFDEKPELSESFLLVDPEQVNDVFAVTDVTDKIFGAVFFDMTAKLPLSRVSIPRLD